MSSRGAQEIYDDIATMFASSTASDDAETIVRRWVMDPRHIPKGEIEFDEVWTSKSILTRMVLAIVLPVPGTSSSPALVTMSRQIDMKCNEMMTYSPVRPDLLQFSSLDACDHVKMAHATKLRDLAAAVPDGHLCEDVAGIVATYASGPPQEFTICIRNFADCVIYKHTATTFPFVIDLAAIPMPLLEFPDLFVDVRSSSGHTCECAHPFKLHTKMGLLQGPILDEFTEAYFRDDRRLLIAGAFADDALVVTHETLLRLYTY